MDAAQKLFKNIVILATAVLLMATLGFAQPTLQVSTAVSFGGTGGYDAPVTSSGSPTTEITFAVGAPVYGDTGSGDWLKAVATNASTQASPAVTYVSFGLKTAPQTSGAHTATVTLTPTAPTGVAAVTITVTYNSGSAGGGTGSGTLVATLNGVAVTSAIPMSAVLNGVATQPIALSTNSSTNVSLVASSANVSWLSGYLGSSTITSAASTTFTLYAYASGLSAGVYSGTIVVTPYIGSTAGTAVTLTVTLTVGSGTSNGTWSVTQSNYPLSYTTNSGSYPTTGYVYPSTTSTTSLCTSSTATCYNMLGPTSSNGWLVLTFPTVSGTFTNPTQIPITTPFVLTVGTAANVLTAGTYTGSVIITDTSGVQQLTVTVTLTVNGGGTNTLTVNPASVSFSSALGGIQQSQTVGVTSTGGGTFYVSGSLPAGLTYNYSSVVVAAGGSASFTVTATPSSLAAGTYSGTLYIYVGTQNATLPVTLIVGSGSSTGTGTSAVSPTSLSFAYETGTNSNFVARQKLAISGTAGAWSSTITTSTGTAWVRLSPSSGTSLPASSDDASVVIVDPTDLTAGTYTATIGITTVGGYQNITVSLIVTSSAVLLPTPGDAVFYVKSPGNKVLPQYVQFSASDSTAGTLAISPVSNNSWITLTSDGSSMTVQADQTGMSTGVYTGSVTVTQSGVANSPLVFPVIMVVNGGGSGGTVTSSITAAPTSLSFSTGLGSSPASQTIGLTSASGTAAVTYTAAVTSGSNWLSVTPTSGSTPSTLTAAVNSASLASGSYVGTIVITPTGGNPVTVAVSLSVSAAPAVSATPTQLSFTYPAGQAVPASQQVTVAGGAFTATASSSGNWLSVSPTSGTAAGPITVSVSPSSLAVGIYTGTIVVAGVSPATGSTTVTVTINVTAPLPTLTKVTNAASYATGSIAPGEIITLFASDTTHPIGPTTPAGLTLDSGTGKVSTSIGGVQVTVNGYNAPLIYASATQVSAVVPYEIKAFTSATVQVKYLGQTSNGIFVNVATTAPALFTANSSGTGPGAILNSNGSVNTSANPATRGDVIVVYLTGEGETSPAGVTGKVTTVASAAPLTPGPLLQPTVTIGGQGANWTFAGEAPGFVSGVMQLNIVVPTNIAAGDQPIVVSFGGNPSQTGVTVSVK